MRRPPLRAAAVLLAGAAALSGCSSSEQPAPSPSSSPAASPTGSAAASSSSLAPDAIGVSPGGVTTAVGAPAESTETGYFQACRAAKTWIDQQGGDPKSQIEPYLAMVQKTDSAGPGTYDKPWSQLTPGQQSGVIVAVQAAADALCG
jgi:hypothetical protein